MPDFHFTKSSLEETRKFPPGASIVISVLVAALIIGTAIGLWLSGSVANSKGWFAAVLTAVVFTSCIAGFGFYYDHLRAGKHSEYLKKLSEIDRKTMRRD